MKDLKREEIIKAIKGAKITHMSDSGHGWYSTPVELLQLLGIEDKISQCSYLKGSRAYLEEDSDGYELMKAIKEYLPGFEPKSSYAEKTPIRNYGSYDNEFAKLSLKDPSDLIGLKLHQSSSSYEITQYEKPYFYTKNLESGQRNKVKENELSKYFISDGAKKKDVEISAVFEMLRSELKGCQFHFYTKDNVSVQVKTKEDSFNFVDFHFDYTIKNSRKGILKIKSLNVNRDISHDLFIDLIKKITKEPLNRTVIEKILADI